MILYTHKNKEAITIVNKKNKLRLNTTLDEDVFNILKEEAQKEGHNKINKVIERITREYLSEGREISSTQWEVILNEFKKFIEQKKIEEKEPTKEKQKIETESVLKNMKHNF